LIFADELSVSALVRGLKEGRTVVKLRGPEDPMIELRELGGVLPRVGDTLIGSSVELEATVRGGEGHVLVWFENGVLAREEKVDGETFVSTYGFAVFPEMASRVRAELRINQQPRTVTSHVWLAESAGLPSAQHRRPGHQRSCSAGSESVLVALGLLLISRRRVSPLPDPLPRGGEGE
jgi:hypothetical protein